jgi:hypothetical protein
LAQVTYTSLITELTRLNRLDRIGEIVSKEGTSLSSSNNNIENDAYGAVGDSDDSDSNLKSYYATPDNMMMDETLALPINQNNDQISSDDPASEKFTRTMKSSKTAIPSKGESAYAKFNTDISRPDQAISSSPLPIANEVMRPSDSKDSKEILYIKKMQKLRLKGDYTGVMHIFDEMKHNKVR